MSWGSSGKFSLKNISTGLVRFIRNTVKTFHIVCICDETWAWRLLLLIVFLVWDSRLPLLSSSLAWLCCFQSLVDFRSGLRNWQVNLSDTQCSLCIGGMGVIPVQWWSWKRVSGTSSLELLRLVCTLCCLNYAWHWWVSVFGTHHTRYVHRLGSKG